MKTHYKIQEQLLIKKSLKIECLYNEKQLKQEAKKYKKHFRAKLWKKMHHEWNTNKKQNKLLKFQHEKNMNTIRKLKNQILELNMKNPHPNLSKKSIK